MLPIAQGKDKAILNQLLSAENTPERTACITTLFETMGVKERQKTHSRIYGRSPCRFGPSRHSPAKDSRIGGIYATTVCKGEIRV